MGAGVASTSISAPPCSTPRWWPSLAAFGALRRSFAELEGPFLWRRGGWDGAFSGPDADRVPRVDPNRSSGALSMKACTHGVSTGGMMWSKVEDGGSRCREHGSSELVTRFRSARGTGVGRSFRLAERGRVPEREPLGGPERVRRVPPRPTTGRRARPTTHDRARVGLPERLVLPTPTTPDSGPARA